MSEDAEVIKVVLVGEAGVRKTCIIQRFCENKFTPNTISTNGAANAAQILKVDDYIFNLDIWDTAGQEIYRSLNRIFYKNSRIAILVYDITNEKSFEEVKEYWYEQVIKANGNNIIIGIVGNKCDLYNKEKVEESTAKEWAESHGCIFQLTSAFQGTGIKDIFNSVCARLVEIKTNKKNVANTKHYINLFIIIYFICGLNEYSLIRLPIAPTIDHLVSFIRWNPTY